MYEQIDKLIGDRESSIYSDLKMNFKNFSTNSLLSPKEAALIVYALALNEGHAFLAEVALQQLRQTADLTEAMIQEAAETPGIMGQLNTYYKFKKFMNTSNPEGAASYGAAKLRMLSLGQPKLGKELFEILALALSLQNGCEQCVVAHEETLRKLQVGPDKIHDVARLTSVTFGLARLLKSN